MNFGEAIAEAKAGNKISRSGWNGKGMFVIYVPSTPDCVLREGMPYAKALEFTARQTVTINSHFDMFTATGEFQPGWLASQTDMDASDWGVVEGKQAAEAA